jgi:hypothetical protein
MDDRDRGREEGLNPPLLAGAWSWQSRYDLYMTTKQIVCWNGLKQQKPDVFEEMVTIIRLKFNVDRSKAIDYMDENWSFQVNRDGSVLALEESTGKPIVFN